jgi:hypothetical protein
MQEIEITRYRVRLFLLTTARPGNGIGITYQRESNNKLPAGRFRILLVFAINRKIESFGRDNKNYIK